MLPCFVHPSNVKPNGEVRLLHDLSLRYCDTPAVFKTCDTK